MGARGRAWGPRLPVQWQPPLPPHGSKLAMSSDAEVRLRTALNGTGQWAITCRSGPLTSTGKRSTSTF